MNARHWLSLLISASCATACASTAQFSGTVVMRNMSPGNVSVYEVRGLERAVPSLPVLAPADVKLAMLGSMRAPDTLRIRWSYVAVHDASGDPNAIVAVLPVPPLLHTSGQPASDLFLTFTAERRWVAGWAAK